MTGGVTEAQLRWAQFQYKKNVPTLSKKIERLYNTPAAVEDVVGYQTEDGDDDSTSTSSGIRSTSCHALNEDDDDRTADDPFEQLLFDKSSINIHEVDLYENLNAVHDNIVTKSSGCGSNYEKTNMKTRTDFTKKRLKRPKISKGRRALLRVSMRELEQRRQNIIQNGYQYQCCTSSGEQTDDESNDYNSEQKQMNEHNDEIDNNHKKERERSQNIHSESSYLLESIFDEEQHRQRPIVLQNLNNGQTVGRKSSDATKSARTRGGDEFRKATRHSQSSIRISRQSNHNHQHNRRHQQKTIMNQNDEEEERIKRFEEALSSMIMQNAVNGLVDGPQVVKDELFSSFLSPSATTTTTATTRRKWTRPSGVRSHYVVEDVTNALQQNSKHTLHHIGIRNLFGNQYSSNYYAEAMKQEILLSAKNRNDTKPKIANTNLNSTIDQSSIFHDLQQMEYLLSHDFQVSFVKKFVEIIEVRIQEHMNQSHLDVEPPHLVTLIRRYIDQMLSNYRQQQKKEENELMLEPKQQQQQQQQQQYIETTLVFPTTSNNIKLELEQRLVEVVSDEEACLLQYIADNVDQLTFVSNRNNDVSLSLESGKVHQLVQEYCTDIFLHQEEDHYVYQGEYVDTCDYQLMQIPVTDDITSSLTQGDDEVPLNRQYHFPTEQQQQQKQQWRFSTEKLRDLVDGLNVAVKESPFGRNIVDTDCNSSIIESNFTNDQVENNMSTATTTMQTMVQDVGSILLSPTLLTKRHQQAIRAIENRKWDQVMYLISANPWLAEMSDINTSSYLLHKLAFYGAGQLEVTLFDSDLNVLSNNKNSSNNDSTSPRSLFRHRPAPVSLNNELIRLCPSAVHKFDQDGNVPLHWAACSANLSMIELLGKHFPEGASVRNYNGMVPLHLAVLACATAPLPITYERPGISTIDIIETMIQLFPGAIAVCDNEGNLPIHIAASVLQGTVGIEIIRCLLQAATKYTTDPMSNIRFRFNNNDNTTTNHRHHQSKNTTKMAKQHETKTSNKKREPIQSPPSETNDSCADISGTTTDCLLVANDRGDTPLLAAVKSKSGKGIIQLLLPTEVVATKSAVVASATTAVTDSTLLSTSNAKIPLLAGAGTSNAQNETNHFLHRDLLSKSLHLLVQEPFADIESIVTILAVCPEVATIRNEDDILPIEGACMQTNTSDIILCIVLVDFPIDIKRTDVVQLKKGYGESWWYLTCDCDDYFIDIVKDVIAMCTFHQLRFLCFMKRSKVKTKMTPNKNKEYDKGYTLLSRATPKCREALRRAMRLIGRYEFIGNTSSSSSRTSESKTSSTSNKVLFDALDFGDEIHPIPLGKPVLLICYSNYDFFCNETKLLRIQKQKLDFQHIEEIVTFSVGGDTLLHHSSSATAATTTPSTKSGCCSVQRYFVSIEQPSLLLSDVINGMLEQKNDIDDPTDPHMRLRYTIKVSAVLRMIAQTIRYLHSNQLVHCHISPDSCGKYNYYGGDGNATTTVSWKLTNFLHCCIVGEVIYCHGTSTSRNNHNNQSLYLLETNAPPEAYVLHVPAKNSNGVGNDNTAITISNRNLILELRDSIVASPAIDCWAFGKLAYEVLTCVPLFQRYQKEQDTTPTSPSSSIEECNHKNLLASSSHSSSSSNKKDIEYLYRWSLEKNNDNSNGTMMIMIVEWNQTILSLIENKLYNSVCSDQISLGMIDLIVQCLDPNPNKRPTINDILRHPVWNDFRNTSTSLASSTTINNKNDNDDTAF